MAEIEIGPLSDRLSEEEIAELRQALDDLGVPTLPRSDESNSTTIGDLDDDALLEFFDRLDAHDAACEAYLPVEFDGRAEVADLRIGSAVLLQEVLEELRDELAIDDDPDDQEDDEEDDYRSVLAAQLRDCWRAFFEGCAAALERRLPLHIKS